MIALVLYVPFTHLFCWPSSLFLTHGKIRFLFCSINSVVCFTVLRKPARFGTLIGKVNLYQWTCTFVRKFDNKEIVNLVGGYVSSLLITTWKSQLTQICQNSEKQTVLHFSRLSNWKFVDHVFFHCKHLWPGNIFGVVVSRIGVEHWELNRIKGNRTWHVEASVGSRSKALEYTSTDGCKGKSQFGLLGYRIKSEIT